MTSLAESVHDLLKGRGETAATAESMTGGQLAALLTAAPGASATFLGGVVSYATEAKIRVLGVDPGLVERHGVVSAECARAMARGVRELMPLTRITEQLRAALLQLRADAAVAERAAADSELAAILAKFRGN